MIEKLQYLSIIIETLIAVFGLALVFIRKKKYGFLIFLTFAIYVFYDFANLAEIDIPLDLMYISFFIATLSALIFVIILYKEKRRK